MTPQIPLAERMRPATLEEVVGQQHLIGPGGILRRIVEGSVLPSMIFWGPPGVGKTTLARILAGKFNLPFYSLSAVHAGVKEVREVIAKASAEGQAVLFLDEIHRFSKSQQDSLLSAIEGGTIRLIGATTENPSFEIIQPLLSRCQVFILESPGKEELLRVAERAVKQDMYLLDKKVSLGETDLLLLHSGGDVRKLLNLLELAAGTSGNGPVVVTNELITQVASSKMAWYDKSGEQHYDIISAFIKSIRGSDPNAALYWLARMIEGGEDPSFIARRMLILSSEDIGIANPTAFVMANNCFQAVNVIGYPDCDLILAQTAVYLAVSDKSNASYMAIRAASQLVRQTGDLPVPLHLRNAPTKLMKEIGYGSGYRYAHDFPGNFVLQQFLPDDLKGRIIYSPGENERENFVRKWLRTRWKDEYGY
jgi:putative ATPase